MRALAIVAVLCRLAAADDKDPSTATWLSIGVTAGGAAVLTAGIVGIVEGGKHCTGTCGLAVAGYLVGGTAFLAGPTIGHWYAGERGWTLGLDLRMAGLSASVAGVVGIAIECYREEDTSTTCRVPRDTPYSMAVFAGAGALIVAGTVWDIDTAGDAVRRMRVAPLVVPGGAGLAVAGAF